MSEDRIEWWIGPGEAVAAALPSDIESVSVITEMSLDADAVAAAHWVGIEPPPAGSKVFTLHAPTEASGGREWVRYRSGSYAPECELVAVRVVR